MFVPTDCNFIHSVAFRIVLFSMVLFFFNLTLLFYLGQVLRLIYNRLTRRQKTFVLKKRSRTFQYNIYIYMVLLVK